MNGLQTLDFPCTFYGTVGFPCTLNYYLLQLYGTVWELAMLQMSQAQLIVPSTSFLMQIVRYRGIIHPKDTVVLVVTKVYGTVCCNKICLFECFKTTAQFKSNLICRWFAPSLYAIRCFAWKSSPSVLHCRVQFFLHCWCRTLSGSKISNIACA